MRSVRASQSVGGSLDDMADCEHRPVDLSLRLLGVPPVDEQRRLVLEDDGQAGRSGKSRQPQEPLGVGGNVLVLMFVGPGDDKSGETFGLQERRAQFRDSARPRCAGPPTSAND